MLYESHEQLLHTDPPPHGTDATCSPDMLTLPVMLKTKGILVAGVDDIVIVTVPDSVMLCKLLQTYVPKT